MLEHIDTLNNVLEYMKHTVYGRIKNVERIEVLKILIRYIAEDKIQCLSETMIYAAWFGETEIVVLFYGSFFFRFGK